MAKRFLCILLMLALLPIAVLGEDAPVFQKVLTNVPPEELSGSRFVVVDDEDEDAPADDALTLTLTLGGDTAIGIREIWWEREDALPAYLAREGMDYPFSELREVFAADDLTFLNLECTLKDDHRGEIMDKEYRFRGLPGYTAVLTGSSVELLNIANNHYVDYREGGKVSTRQALDDAGLPYSGYGYAYIWQQDGYRIGFAGCRETEYKRDPDVIARETAELRRLGCDVVIYSCHWGREYAAQHNEQQLEMAQAAAKAGVDVIVGTHPHVVQGLSEVDGTVVLWSLGNLMFGGTIKMQTFDGTLARLQLHFANHRYTGCTVSFLPVLTSSIAAAGRNDYRPVLAEGADRRRIMDKIAADSTVPVDRPVSFPARK